MFIPHLGCPNDCVFCDQRTISGKTEFSESDVVHIIDEALETLEGTDRKGEIAFFGGSFTGIDPDLMIRLLDTAQTYVDAGKVSGIRMSTRPDYISEEIINVLKKYTVSQVELGIQSMTDSVLAASRRGHSALHTERACALLKEAGISFAGQMMIGLPKSTPFDEVYCAEKICSLGADACRVYPTIVFKGTCLEAMTKRGDYTPLSVEEAVERAASVLEVFEKHGVTCLRVGLQDSEALHDDERYLAGPVHAAIGELVRGEVLLRRIKKQLKEILPCEELTVEVARGRISTAVGQNGNNKKHLISSYGIKKLKFTENEALTGLNINVHPSYEADAKNSKRRGTDCI